MPRIPDKVAGTLRVPSADVGFTESEPSELAPPTHPLADLGLFVLTLAALALVLVGMLMGPVAGLVTPEL